MPTLVDVRDVIRDTRGLLNSISGKYDYMNLIGINQEEDNQLYYLQKEIREGFYYKPSNDTISYVPVNDAATEALKKASMIELVNDDGTFVRFTFAKEGKTEPKRPTFQWILTVEPNKADKRPIIG